MPYNFENRESASDEKIYFFETEHQSVIVNFQRLEGNFYKILVWSDDQRPLIGYHKHDFQETLYNIIERFDKGRGLIYETFTS